VILGAGYRPGVSVPNATTLAVMTHRDLAEAAHEVVQGVMRHVRRLGDLECACQPDGASMRVCFFR
jgi:hypothetical protein